MSLETQFTRLANTFRPQTETHEWNVRKLEALHDNSVIEPYQTNSSNKLGIGEMVATVSDVVPFARVVQGPYIKNGDEKDNPSYTLQDSNGFYQVSSRFIGGVPLDEKDPSRPLLASKAEQLKSSDNNSLANVKIDFGPDIGVRYVPIFKAITMLGKSITSDGSDHATLAPDNSDETKQVVTAYLKALDSIAQESGRTYPHGEYRRLTTNELTRLHEAVA